MAIFVLAAVAFVAGIILMRVLKQRMSPDAAVRELRGASGGIEAYHAVIARMKEQEKELARLRESDRQKAATTENLSVAVLTNLTSGVVVFNRAGMVTQANPAARSILGYASPSGLHARDLFRGTKVVRRPGETATEPAVLQEAVQQALRDGQGCRRLEAEYATPAGEERTLALTVSPVDSGGGQRLGAACLISDLSEIAKLSRQVQLRERQAALGEMSAGIAHEFKNSLATISGYAQMLQAETDPTVHQFADKIASETSSLTRIVTDFLNFARPQEIEWQDVRLRPLLEECAQECGIETALDGVAPDFQLHGDRTALRQAFANLFRNSIEATKDKVKIEVMANAEIGSHRVIFRDESGGIAAEVLPKIFIPFFTTKSEGTGLGLPLVHRIVTDHGGTIQVASDGRTTTFTLSFPAGKLAREAENQG